MTSLSDLESLPCSIKFKFHIIIIMIYFLYKKHAKLPENSTCTHERSFVLRTSKYTALYTPPHFYHITEYVTKSIFYCYYQTYYYCYYYCYYYVHILYNYYCSTLEYASCSTVYTYRNIHPTPSYLRII